jgi:hypothetical protein
LEGHEEGDEWDEWQLLACGEAGVLAVVVCVGYLECLTLEVSGLAVVGPNGGEGQILASWCVGMKLVC